MPNGDEAARTKFNNSIYDLIKQVEMQESSREMSLCKIKLQEANMWFRVHVSK